MSSLPPPPPESHPQTDLSMPIKHDPVQASCTLDDDPDNVDPSIPTHAQPQPRRPPFGLGEHIMNVRNDPSFLSLSTPDSVDSPIVPQLPPRSPFRPPPAGLRAPGTPILEGEFEFMSLSPPPRRGSKQLSVTLVQTEKGATTGAELPAVSEMESSSNPEESGLSALSRASVVSLGFISR